MHHMILTDLQNAVIRYAISLKMRDLKCVKALWALEILLLKCVSDDLI